MRNIAIVASAFILLSGCASVKYTLVEPEERAVAKGSMLVRPSVEWNKLPKAPTDIPSAEVWTRNGPLLDSVTFIGALPPGNSIMRQHANAEQRVPKFESGMSPQDLVSVIESYYRIRAGASVFEAQGLKPATFVGKPGLQFDYAYVTKDSVRRRGRALIAVVDDKLYLMTLDGTALHYFDRALPDFDALAASATIS